MRPLVLKLGGELVETAEDRARLAGVARSLVATRALVVVHGGGRSIDAELARRGIAPKKVDGLRVTDAPTLDAVVAVLAGLANTELVAALVAAGVPAVGLTGVDAGFGRAVRSNAHQTSGGATVDLGLVGDPADVDPALITLLAGQGYVPVVASLGVDAAFPGIVLNVNADVMACRLAAALGHCDLVIAGATAGVLDGQGELISSLDTEGIERMIATGTATAGMIAKLSACRTALHGGVASVRIVDGRSIRNADDLEGAPGTRLFLEAHAASEREAARMTTDTASPADVKALELEHVLQIYRRIPVVFTHGEGVRLHADDGRSFLDFVSGIGVASLGHAHPGLAKAVADQASTLLHTSNLYFHPLQGQLATRLSALTGLERAFFCNSGTEAVEGCLKFARRYWHTRGETARTEFVAFTHSFHGRTMGSLSVTWDDHYRGPFQPLIPGVTFAPADDPAALDRLVTDKTAAIIAEPIQGEGGVRPLSPALIAAIGAARQRTGALVIADEVQSGSGRTGEFTYSTTLGLRPDLMALGKALGAGVPIGAVMLSADVAKAASPGDHGTTYGGNLLACRAALTFLDALDHGLQDHVRRVSAHLFSALRALASRYPAAVADVRGAGLLAGLDLRADAQPVVNAALERGLLINRTSTTVVRLLPPYIVTERDIDEAMKILDASLESAGT